MMSFKRKSLLLILPLTLYTSIAAADTGFLNLPCCTKTVVSLLGGYARLNVQQSDKSFVGTDDDVFTYNRQGSSNGGFLGLFLGYEFPVIGPGFFTQAGIEYDYYASATVNGKHTVGIQPDTSTLYDYRYHTQTQQLMAVAKLLYNVNSSLHPFALIGIGAAFNELSSFNASTAEEGSINIAPTFNDHNRTSFTYALGLGLDVDVTPQVRMGFGYRFSDFGSSSLGKGYVNFHDYQASVPFTLGSSHTYANEFVLNLTYLA